jgi:hypothetical protein
MQKSIFQRIFRFYFAFILIAFVIAILLMNLPRSMAGEVIAHISDATAAPAAVPEEATWQEGMKSLVRWKVSSPAHPMKGEGSFIEFRGSKMAFTVRF